MQRFLPVGKDAKGAARFLLAALPALGAVLTALAVTGDLVGRMARNHPWASFGAFGCGALGVSIFTSGITSPAAVASGRPSSFKGSAGTVRWDSTSVALVV